MHFPPLSHSRRLLLILIVGISGSVDFRAKADLVTPDTRGPVQNAGMVVKVDEEGVQAPGFHWEKPPDRDKWTAKFIQSAAPKVPDSIETLLRKEVVLKKTPKKVVAWISAITTDYGDYLLYVNGKAAARGPADVGWDNIIDNGLVAGSIDTKRTMYDFRDLTPLFHKGKNSLAVELACGSNAFRSSGSKGFLFEAEVEYSDGTKELIVSDETWKGISSPCLKKMKIPEDDLRILGVDEMLAYRGFDAQAEPVGWQQVGFQDDSWPVVSLVPFPSKPMTLSEQPPLMEAFYPYFEITRVHGGVTVPKAPFKDGNSILITSDGEFGVHFKRIMAGRCGIKVKGTKGATLYLQMCERDGPGGHESARNLGVEKTYPILLRDGVQYFECRDFYGLGTINVIARHVTSPIEIMDISADSLSQPVSYQGSFECNDTYLNALWKSMRWSTQMNMATHHLDSPSNQESLRNYGASLISDLITYYSMGDNPWLARQDLRKQAWLLQNSQCQTSTPSYILNWVCALMNYYDFTGDQSVVNELAPDVYAVIDRFASYIGKNGLICNAPNYFFCDFASVADDKNPAIHYGMTCPPAGIGQGYMTAFFYRALADAQRVSLLTHDDAHYQKYTALRAKITEAYNRELWNETKGLYRDGKPFVTDVKPNARMAADVDAETFSAQNNTLAVLYDLAPPDRQASIIKKLMESPTLDITTFFLHYVFEAMDHAGVLGAYAVPLFHQWVIIPGTQTVKEKLRIHADGRDRAMGDGTNDYTHDWNGTPMIQMSSKILGVVPTSPAFATFDIRPTLCGLEFAKGRVPTPHGPIDVDWKNNDQQFTISVKIPAGTKAVLAIPTEENSKITSNGKLIWNGKAAADSIPEVSNLSRKGKAVELTLSPGAYSFKTTMISVK